jgi:hypothetical protein
MNATNPYFDDRIADWLEDDPTVAPAQLLETVLAAVPSISQRRVLVPWARLRLVPATRFGLAAAMLAAVALLLVALVGFTITGPPKPTATATATPGFGLSGAMTTFTSPLYGYTMDHPVEWTVRQATVGLDEAWAPWIDSPGVDYTSSNPAADVTFTPGVIVGATRVAPGRTLDAWTNLVTVATCGEPGGRDTITVDGESAALLEYARCNGLHHLWASAIHDGVGYHIVWLGPPGTEAQDRLLFDAMVATFRFPATPPSPPSSPAASTIGEPLLDSYIGAWYHAAPAWMWFVRAGDPACTALALTDLDCVLWQPVGKPIEAGGATIEGNELTVHWVRGYCAGVISRYTAAFLGADSLTLTEQPGGCEGGNFPLTRAGTGTAPTAPPQPAP